MTNAKTEELPSVSNGPEASGLLSSTLLPASRG
jgi:hypothetical protein